MNGERDLVIGFLAGLVFAAVIALAIATSPPCTGHSTIDGRSLCVRGR
jgi:hypothetical protein